MEKEILLFFHKTIANKPLDVIMYFFTDKGWSLIIPIFVFLVLWLLKEKKYIPIIYLTSCLTIAIFLSDWFSEELKILFQRIRPCWEIDFRNVVGCTNSYSFPSSHTSNGFAIATVFALFIRNYLFKPFIRKALYFYIFSVVVLVGFSRIYLGVHYPTDVLAGALIGILIGFSLHEITQRVNSFRNFFYFFLIILSLFRVYFILHGPLDLSPDEAHYWEWSRRLDLSYYSKGPMIAYLIALSTWFFGDNPLGVRVLAVVFSLLSSIFLYKIGSKLFNEKVGYISGVLFQLIPLFSTYGILFTIDSPFILFWIISIYLFLNSIEGEKIHWILLGFFIGLGLLTKYTMAFFYLCMLIYLFRVIKNSSPETRNNRENYFKNPWFYACIMVSIIVFSPVIIWNFQHDWVTLKHTAGQAHIYEGVKISLKSFIEFIGSQLIVLTPLILIAGAYFILKPSALNLQPQQWLAVFCFSMPVLVFFLLKSLHGKVQANWAMPAYIPFLLVIAHAFEKKLYKKLLTFSIILALILTVLSHAIPYLKLSAQIDPSARLKGWRELGVKVAEIKKEMEKNGKVVIFSDRYQISSELAFYVKGHPPVYCINLGRRMNQYDLWGSINDELYSDRKTHGIYVVYGIKDKPESKVSSAFENCLTETFTAYRKDVKIKDYTIFKCYAFKGMFLEKPVNY